MGKARGRETLPTRTVGGIPYHIQRYRPRIEGLFARIERWTNVADPSDVHWRSISKENILALYGKGRRLAHRRSREPSAYLHLADLRDSRR